MNKNNKSQHRTKNQNKKQQPDKEAGIEIDGMVVENLSNGRFSITLCETEATIIAHISGKIRTNYIKILPGDKVRVEVSPYDLTRGRIVFRHR